MNKILILSLMAVLASSNAFAASSGSCGTRCTWSLDGNNLTITGSDDPNNPAIMDDYDSYNNNWNWETTAPWGSNINNVNFQGNIGYIGSYAFYKAGKFTEVTIPETVKSMGNCAFFGSSNLKTLTIPSSISVIGDNAFRNAYNLTSVTIPNTVTTIGKYAFSDAEKLKELTIPNSVTSIDIQAFYNATSLEKLYLSENITSIGWQSFHNTTNLQELRLPNTVLDNIADGAFTVHPNKANPNLKIYCSASNAQKCQEKAFSWGAGGGVDIYPDYTYDKSSGKYTFYCETTDSICNDSKSKISLLFGDNAINTEPIMYTKTDNGYIIDGKTYASLSQYAMKQLMPKIVRRIYTVSEATKAKRKGSKNTFSIKYR